MLQVFFSELARRLMFFGAYSAVGAGVTVAVVGLGSQFLIGNIAGADALNSGGNSAAAKISEAAVSASELPAGVVMGTITVGDVLDFANTVFPLSEALQLLASLMITVASTAGLRALREWAYVLRPK